jgi:hypothetical protein
MFYHSHVMVRLAEDRNREMLRDAEDWRLARKARSLHRRGQSRTHELRRTSRRVWRPCGRRASGARWRIVGPTLAQGRKCR